MASVRSVKFNFVMNAILTASSVLFPIIIYPYVSRVIGPSGIGRVSFANANIAYFSMFAQLGIPTYGIRACAQVRDDRKELSRTVQEIFFINMITCIAVYAAFLASLYLVPDFREEKRLYVVMSMLIIFNTLGVEWLYKGLEMYSYITKRSLIFKLIGLAAVFMLIRSEEDYVIYGGITIFAAVGSNIINFINLRKIIDIRPVGGLSFKKHLKPILIFLAMSVATTVYTNMDSVMLGFIKGTTENGYYDAAVKIKNILVGVVASLGTVLMPRLSVYAKEGRMDELSRIAAKALEFVLLISIPLSVYFVLFAGPSINLLSGELFAASVSPMRAIMPTLIFIGLTNIIGLQCLVPLGREKEVLYSEIAGALINVAVNAVLIPRLGALGAAIGTVAAEIVVFIVQVYYMRDMVTGILRSLPYVKLIVGVAAAGAASMTAFVFNFGSFLTLAFSACIFFGVYYILMLIMKEGLVIEISGQIGSMIKKKLYRG